MTDSIAKTQQQLNDRHKFNIATLSSFISNTTNQNSKSTVRSQSYQSQKRDSDPTDLFTK